MRTKIIVAALAAMFTTAVAPSLAWATATPPLTSGASQAFVADSGGTPQGGSVSLAGPFTRTGAASVICTGNAFQVDYVTAGTASITSFVASGCTVTGFPGCPITTTSTSLPWGARLQWTSTTGYTLHVNTSFTIAFGAGTPTCPAPAGAYPYTGLFQPMLSIGSGVLSATFDAGSGSASGPLGSLTADGTIAGSLPANSTQLVH